MAPTYARSSDASDTVLFTFRVVHDYRATIDGDITDSPMTGKSPISRWLAWAVDYDDFVSNPDAIGYVARCQIPRGTIAMEFFARIDTAFAHATPGADIDIGDGNDPDGWGDSDDWTSANTIVRDANAAYNNQASDPSAGVAGWQYYRTGDTLDIKWNNATAPTAGKAVVFLKCVSYNEAPNAEW
jgi:hypothetical protein